MSSRRVDRRRPGNLCFNITLASMGETLTLLLANNKCADQPAYPHSLISAFVIRYLKGRYLFLFSIFDIWSAST